MASTIQEKAEELRRRGYDVKDSIGTRTLTGENVLYVNGTDLDEQFVDQLLGGADFAEVQYRRNVYLLKSQPLNHEPKNGSWINLQSHYEIEVARDEFEARSGRRLSRDRPPNCRMLGNKRTCGGSRLGASGHAGIAKPLKVTSALVH